MKILQLSNRIPYPPKDGGAIAMLNMTYGFLREGCEVKLLALNTSKHFVRVDTLPSELREKAGLEAVYIKTNVKPWSAFINLLFSKESYNIIRFYSKEFEDKLIEILKNENFDIIQLEGLHISIYLDTIRKYSKAKISLRAHNAEHLIWQRLAEAETKSVKKWYLRILADRMKNYELGVLNKFDSIIAITEEDAMLFKRLGCAIPIHVSPTGLDVQQYKIEKRGLEKNSLFHLGALDWLPNQQAIQWFLEDIWQKVIDKRPELKFYLAGRNLPDWLKQIDLPNVIVVGEIPNAMSFINSKEIMIVPLLSGSGMRIKIIEGMALGKTIISTSIGAEGIPYTKGEDILIADTSEEFVNAIEKCVTDATFAEKIGKNARFLAENNFDNKKLMLFFEICFWVCAICVIHSYVLFPLILAVFSKNKHQNKNVWFPNDAALPKVSILLAAYNEEKVIEQKIQSIFNTNYPHDKIEVLIGSDASTDRTNEIILKYTKIYPRLILHNFAGRTGKAEIINTLSDKATNDIFILTDANVLFRQNTIYQLVKHYKNSVIAVVGGNILNTNLKKDGISNQEKTYLDRENIIKFQEGVLWGTMIGAFGGCYSIRKTHYIKVPPRFFMDDFFITMSALSKGGKAINELHATCYEDISNKISEEFRRKIRISIGNFQNLSRYYKLLFPPYSAIGFCFLSHKVLRWFGPLFILLIFICLIPLSGSSFFFKNLFLLQILSFLIPILDSLLKKIKIHFFPLRLISHFYLMNLAMLIGLIRFLKGVKTNVWKPTERFQ